MTAPNPAHEGQEQLHVLRCAWKTGLWRYFVFLLIYSIGRGFQVPKTVCS